MNIFWQTVPKHDYLEALLCYAATYNPNLRSFVDYVGYPDLEADQGRRLLAGLKRLYRTAPSMETPYFRDKVEAILNM